MLNNGYIQFYTSQVTGTNEWGVPTESGVWSDKLPCNIKWVKNELKKYVDGQYKSVSYSITVDAEGFREAKKVRLFDDSGIELGELQVISYHTLKFVGGNQVLC